MAPCSTRRTSSTVSPRIWKCRRGKERLGLRSVQAWRKGIITDFAKKAKSQLIKEGNFMAARALDFLVCGAINEPCLPVDGSVPNPFFCVRCDQRAFGHQEARIVGIVLGNRLINHTHIKESELLVTWSGNSGTRIKFCLPVAFCRVTGYLRANSQNIRRSMFLVASDGSGGSRENSQISETGRIWSGHLLVAATCVTHSWEAMYQADRRFQEPSCGELSESSAVSARSRTSTFRLMRTGVT